MLRPPRLRALPLAAFLALAGCTSGHVTAATPPAPVAPETSSAPGNSASSAVPSAGSSSPSSPAPSATDPPAWLGTRVLADGPTGFPPPQPTPPELVRRSIVSPDVLPRPRDDAFAFHVEAVPDDVLARSTWEPACPVDRDELRHVTLTFWGFDGDHHTGELLVHVDVAADVVDVFARMHELRFPLERVAITTPAELAAPPTGDGNTTSAFVCRPTVGSSSWSAHAHGLAIDVNPFHNPYVRETDRGRIVLPELATAYTDRTLDLPGMIHPDGAVVAAFEAVGWTWGGTFATVADLHHFSATGR